MEHTFDDFCEGHVYTINDQNKVLIIAQEFFHKCRLNQLFPIEVTHLIVSYATCPIYYAEFSLLRDDKQLPAISTLTTENIKQSLLQTLKALSVILTQQKSYLAGFDNKMETFNTSAEKVREYQNELYHKCRSIKESMIKDILSAIKGDKIRLDIEIYDAMIHCVFTNLSIQFQTSQGFCSHSVQKVCNWEVLANGREDVLNEKLENMKKERRSQFALQILELWYWLYNTDIRKLDNAVLTHIKDRLNTNKDINLLISFCGKFNYAEIDAMKFILHRIYDQYIFLRQRIRTKMLAQIQTFMYAPELVNGRDMNEIIAYGMDSESNENENFSYAINTFLELMWCIVSGLNVPLKNEWIEQLLLRVLLPLHKISQNRFVEYSDWLYYVTSTFCEKETAVIGPIVLHYLIRYWPCRSVTKMKIFTNEIHFVFGYFVQSNQESKAILSLAKYAMHKIFIPMSHSETDELRKMAHIFWNNETITAVLGRFCEKDRNEILEQITHIPKEANTNTAQDFPIQLPAIGENDTDI